jgi:hypothetical protein
VGRVRETYRNKGETTMQLERDDNWITPPAEPDYEATQAGKQLSDNDELLEPEVFDCPEDNFGAW